MEQISTLEMLPDEMILLICQYFRDAEILYSFFNLNSRLNATITDYCHYVNLMNVTHKQFDFVVTQIIPQISLSIRSFVFNGLWENIMYNELNSIFFHWKLSLMFPQLHTLSLVNFIDRQLNFFLDKITDLMQLVKLDIRNFRGERTEELLKKVLAANNNRLKSVLFDYDSIGFILNGTKHDEAVSYPNIEELIVNLETDKMLEYLFILAPHINRLHIDFDQLSSTSKSTLANISSLVHLKDFQLRSININWSLDEITYILNKMPSLQRLALDLCTEDEDLVNGQNFSSILPSSLVEIHFFIIYYFSRLHSEVITLMSTWPTHIRITCLLDESNAYTVIHTIPCDLPSIIIPAKISKCMLAGSEYTRKVKDLTIFDEQCSTDIHQIVQHFHRLRTLTIGSKNNLEILTFQLTQPIILHLPYLTHLNVKGVCEIFRLVQAAPNLEYLRINLNCLNIALNDVSTCELLQKRIVDLEITDIQELDSIQLDVVAQKFNHLRDFSLFLKNPKIFVDSLILQMISLWKEKNLRGLYINGSLTDEVSKNFRQWLISHSHLRQEDSFIVKYENSWIVLWLL
ncbi:unnamed protein product [Rotaria sordida]|uniref:F-box domain-containing protein n=1 Tax=Rotaria sordida TaxID=392033 RepID=A0A815R3F1_9BILA|nr:unnamed protein product [Rotaria sordida]CAF1471627.1 unnamed protein product [Rotaria sordida]